MQQIFLILACAHVRSFTSKTNCQEVQFINGIITMRTTFSFSYIKKSCSLNSTYDITSEHEIAPLNIVYITTNSPKLSAKLSMLNEINLSRDTNLNIFRYDEHTFSLLKICTAKEFTNGILPSLPNVHCSHEPFALQNYWELHLPHFLLFLQPFH
jgi:hypothetical protein